MGEKNPSKNSRTMARLPREIVIAVLRDTQTSAGQVTHALKSRFGRCYPEDPFNLNGSVSIGCLEITLTCQFKGCLGKPRLSQLTPGIDSLSGKGESGNGDTEQQPGGSQMLFRFLL